MRRLAAHALLLSFCAVLIAQQLAVPAQCAAKRRSHFRHTPQTPPAAQKESNTDGSPVNNSTTELSKGVPAKASDVSGQSGTAGPQPALPVSPVIAQTQPPKPASPQIQSEADVSAAELATAPEELPPPVPPAVSYQDGLLSISAANSTLASILTELRVHTGATINVPLTAEKERVVFHFGPAPPRDVISALLDGSSFNYVMVGPDEPPGGVQRLVLWRKTTAVTDKPVNSARKDANAQIEASEINQVFEQDVQAGATSQPGNQPPP